MVVGRMSALAAALNLSSAGTPTGRANDRQLLRLAGIALAAAVWVLSLFPLREPFSISYAVQVTVAIGALVLLELTAPDAHTPPLRRAVWLVLELALCFAVVRTQMSTTRLSLIYLVPASRSLLMFGASAGLPISLSVWLVYGANVAIALLPNKAEEAAVNRERNRLAREIHDSVAHYLTVVNLQLEAVEKLGTDQPERAVREAKRARRLTVECLQEVRRSVGALRSATLEELSLAGALKKLASVFAENTGMDVQLDLEVPEDLSLPFDTRLALYRAAQEGLTNVQRHAHARSARVVLARENGHVELAVEDDGIGPGSSRGESGFGLTGLRERVELLGGQLGFGSAPEGGSRLSVRLPAAHEPAAASTDVSVA